MVFSFFACGGLPFSCVLSCFVLTQDVYCPSHFLQNCQRFLTIPQRRLDNNCLGCPIITAVKHKPKYTTVAQFGGFIEGIVLRCENKTAPLCIWNVSDSNMTWVVSFSLLHTLLPRTGLCNLPHLRKETPYPETGDICPNPVLPLFFPRSLFLGPVLCTTYCVAVCLPYCIVPLLRRCPI